MTRDKEGAKHRYNEFGVRLGPRQLRLIKAVGGYRDGQGILAIDTGRWYWGAPEQLNVAVRSARAGMYLLLSKSIRVPQKRRKKRGAKLRPYLFVQHVPAIAYSLNETEYAQSFLSLLRTIATYSTERRERPGSAAVRVRLDTSRELSRSPLSNLYRVDHFDRPLVTTDNCFEKIEVRCENGELPPKPAGFDLLRFNTDEYRAALAEFATRCKGHCSKRYEFVVSRRCGPGEEHGFSHFPTWQLSIPLETVPRLARQFPSWWEATIKMYRSRAPGGFDTTPIKPDQALKELKAPVLHADAEAEARRAPKPRLFNWVPAVIDAELSPELVRDALRPSNNQRIGTRAV